MVFDTMFANKTRLWTAICLYLVALDDMSNAQVQNVPLAVLKAPWRILNQLLPPDLIIANAEKLPGCVDDLEKI